MTEMIYCCFIFNLFQSSRGHSLGMFVSRSTATWQQCLYNWITSYLVASKCETRSDQISCVSQHWFRNVRMELGHLHDELIDEQHVLAKQGYDMLLLMWMIRLKRLYDASVGSQFLKSSTKKFPRLREGHLLRRSRSSLENSGTYCMCQNKYYQWMRRMY